MKRIKILDSFRGIAALIVVFHHVFTRFFHLYPNISQSVFYPVFDFVSELNLEAVLFFFILSGFSIRLSLKGGVPVNKTLLNDYLYRRFKRILPLYLVSLALTVVCGIAIHQILSSEYSIKNLLGNILFLQISKSNRGYWFPPYGENGPLWSLSFEMFYYLFFPLFIFILLKIFRNTSKHFYLISLAFSFAFSVLCAGLNNYFFFPYIAFGALFFIWYSGYFISELYMNNKLGFDINLLFFVICYLFIFLLTLKFPSSNLDKLGEGAIFSIAFVTGYLLRHRLPYRLISLFDSTVNFLFYRIGKGSFALYLLHYPVILVLKYYQASLWVVIISMIFVIFLSIQTEEYFIKKKFLFLKRNYI